MRPGSVLGTLCRGVRQHLLRLDQGSTRQVRDPVDVRPIYGETTTLLRY